MATNSLVAPLAGAWIETILNIQKQLGIVVAPLVGAWIETREFTDLLKLWQSHPSRVCGLKYEQLYRSH